MNSNDQIDINSDRKETAKFSIGDVDSESKTECLVVEMEHAYANNNAGAVSQDRDPLATPEFNPITEIKTEIMTDDIEIKEETESLETEYAPEAEYYENMETSGCSVPFINSMVVEDRKYIPFNAESVPKDVYMELEERYKNKLEQLESMENENKSLKLQILNLDNQQRKVDSSIQKRTKIFYKDLQKMNEKHMDLQNAMDSIKDENMKYKKCLNACITPGASNGLENTINELKKRAQNFVNLEKEAIAKFKILKDEMDKKEQENHAAKLKLAAGMKMLANFQRRFARRNVAYCMNSNLTRELQLEIKKMQHDLKAKVASWTTEICSLKAALKQANEINIKKDGELLQLKNTISASDATCKALEMSSASKDIEISDLKKCLEISRETIRNKDNSTRNIALEVVRMKNAVSVKDSKIKVLMEKYNLLMNNFDRKVKEGNQNVIKSRQKLIDFKNHMSQKYLENDRLKATIAQLEENIKKLETKGCEYCGL